VILLEKIIRGGAVQPNVQLWDIKRTGRLSHNNSLLLQKYAVQYMQEEILSRRRKWTPMNTRAASERNGGTPIAKPHTWKEAGKGV
jgi:hypothetical protein